MAGIWHSRLVSYMAVACVAAGGSAYFACTPKIVQEITVCMLGVLNIGPLSPEQMTGGVDWQISIDEAQS